MKKINLIKCSFIILLSISSHSVIAQQYIDGIIWCEIIDQSCIPNENGITQNNKLNSVMSFCGMIEFKPAFEQCKTKD